MMKVSAVGTLLLLFAIQTSSQAGLINLSVSASGSLALDNTFAGGDSMTTDNFPGAEAPAFALDGDLNTKYLIFVGDDGTANNSGILVFFDEPVVVEAIRFGFANDAPERDPWYYTIEGSNAVNQATYGAPPATVADAPAWTPILVGPDNVTGMVDASDTFFDVLEARLTYTDEAPFFRSAAPFTNDTAYSAYRILIPQVRVDAGIMQVAEIQLLGVPEPAAIGLLSLSLAGLLAMRRRTRI